MHKPLVIVCVKWGRMYSAYYVNTLFDMVRRNLPQGSIFTFHCFTDDSSGLHPSIKARELPGTLTGWWNKLYLFKAGMFEEGERILYFDLDTLILGSLGDLLTYQGDFAILQDFYRPHGYGSGVMLWRAGACDSIWSAYEAKGYPTPDGGDQAWIESARPGVDRLQNCFPAFFASYKTDCHPLPPPGACVVCFHGEPKQDNCDATWVREVWKPEGVFDAGSLKTYPTIQEELLIHAGHAAALPYPWLKRVPEHQRTAVIIGSGVTLDECRDELRMDREQETYDFFATGNATTWLAQNSIRYDAHVMCNAGQEQVSSVPENNVPCYYASTCHEAVLAKAGDRLILWHPDIGGIAAMLGEAAGSVEWVKGGVATGLRAIWIALVLGYRRFHFYGLDSCILGPTESERNRILSIELLGRRFDATTWMLRQVDEFIKLADMLLPQGCAITIHGDGLLHFLATHAQRPPAIVSQ